MESPNILFTGKKTKRKNDSIISTNVRNSKPSSQTSKTKRQSRSDKKHDIKINLTLRQRQQLKRITKIKKDLSPSNPELITPTSVCTELMKKALLLKGEFPEVPYPKSDSKKGRAKLEDKFYSTLFDFSIKWDCSVAKAAHRIFSNILEMEGKHYDQHKI